MKRGQENRKEEEEGPEIDCMGKNEQRNGIKLNNVNMKRRISYAVCMVKHFLIRNCARKFCFGSALARPFMWYKLVNWIFFYSIRTTNGIAINFVFHSCAHCAFFKLIENGNNNYNDFARFRFIMLKFGLWICSYRPNSNHVNVWRWRRRKNCFHQPKVKTKTSQFNEIFTRCSCHKLQNTNIIIEVGMVFCLTSASTSTSTSTSLKISLNVLLTYRKRNHVFIINSDKNEDDKMAV